MLKRKILLLEPDYKNKYPPIGLMKIASYHRILGDEVVFFKGNLNSFFFDQVFEKCFNKLNAIDSQIDWGNYSEFIKSYLKSKKSTDLLFDPTFDNSSNKPLIFGALDYYKSVLNSRRKGLPEELLWDRIYVTTLFTFYWNVTVKTIKFAKTLVDSPFEKVLVGGVLASLLSDELEAETGIKPMKGLLDKPGILDSDNSLIVDDMPLDYSILEEIEYKYPTDSAYFTFMTKGCTRTCSFCSVPKLEPTYKEKIPTIDKFDQITEKFGEQRNLLLMDNNVLASPKFPEIIQEIKDMGFYKGATYNEPNQLKIGIERLKENYNDKAYVKRCFELIFGLQRKLRGKVGVNYLETLEKYKLTKLETATKENILAAYPHIEELYEARRSKGEKLRFVDFNQGTDCRYVTEENMRLLSEIPIKPLRIAFDYIGIRKQYENAVRLAAKYGIRELSNYLLYNFKDSPEDLYERLKLNIELARELNLEIYSFPMKYIPLFGEEAKHRRYIGAKWNKKFVRAIQSIINVTKGIVASGDDFYYKAFGRTLEEYKEILYMPEQYIVYRKTFEKLGFTQRWREEFNNLSDEERNIALPIIESSDFNDLYSKTDNANVLDLLLHYTIKNEDLDINEDEDYSTFKRRYDKLISEDRFKELTLTYDFDSYSPKKTRLHG